MSGSLDGPMGEHGHVTHRTAAGERRGFAESFVGADANADAERARGLRRMKLVALSFLLGATVIFLLCSWAQRNGDAAAWVGYVRAAAEAGMVGALADWFAVTALFKHPLGIPIPHTAIIKRKKDQLGEGLGTFVRENFMSEQVVETKLRDADVAARTGKWLSEQRNAERVAAEVSTVLRVLVEMLRDEDVQQVLDRMIVKRIAEPQWGPPIGRVLHSLLEEDGTLLGFAGSCDHLPPMSPVRIPPITLPLKAILAAERCAHRHNLDRRRFGGGDQPAEDGAAAIAHRLSKKVQQRQHVGRGPVPFVEVT